MKKVFLVIASIVFKSGLRSQVILSVFASAKKALTYANYMRLLVDRKGVQTVFGFHDSSDVVESVSIDFKSESISTIDWSDNLKALQDKQCDFFEADSIAEEQRNIELTKKYNLLEFV